MSDTEKLKITSREGAFEAIEKALEGVWDDQLLDIDIQGEWSTISILIKGDNYHATLNGRLIKALADLQTQLNRIYANAVYGKSAKALSNEEREEIELVFQVSESSSLIEVELGEWLTKLGEAGIEKMTGTDIVFVVIGLAVIWGGDKAYRSYNDRKQNETNQEHETARRAQDSQAETERHNKLIDQLAMQNETVQMALKERGQLDNSVLKATPTAESVDINGQHYSRDEIVEANRSERQSTELERIDGIYYVTNIGSRGDSFSVSLVDEHGASFRADLTKDKLKPDELDELWQAVRDDTLADLKLTARTRQGAITSATLIGLQSRQVAH